MKKYLMIGATAMVLGATLFSSCSKEKDLYDPYKNAEDFVSNYRQAFIRVYGQPAANQDWGFGSSAQSRMTRAISVNGDAYDAFTFPTTEELAAAFPTAVPDDAEEVDNLPTLYIGKQYTNQYGTNTATDLYAVYQNFIGEGHNLKVTRTGEVSIGGSYMNIFNGEYKYYNVYVDVEGDLTINRVGDPHFNLYILHGNVTLPSNFGEMSGLISVAKGATLNDQRNSIAANGGVKLFNRGTINATNSQKYDIGNKSTVYNENQFVVTGALTYSPGAGNTSYFINFGDDAVLTAPSMTLNSTCHFFTDGTVTIAGETAVTQQAITWINNGHYTTGSMRFSAQNTTFYNYCQLVVNNVCMFLDGVFNLMDNSYAQVGQGLFNNFIVNMGNNAGFNVLNGSKWGRQAQGTYQGFRTFDDADVAYVRLAGQTSVPSHNGAAFHVQGSNLTFAYQSIKFFNSQYSGIGQYSNYDNIGYGDETTAQALADVGDGRITWDIHNVTKLVTGNDFASVNATIVDGQCAANWSGPVSKTESIRIFAEDLSANEGTDLDFNDVVFDVIADFSKGESVNKVTIKVWAAGGVLPLKINSVEGVGGFEVHSAMSVPNEKTMINTHAKNYVVDPYDWKDNVPMYETEITLANNASITRSNFKTDVNNFVRVEVMKKNNNDEDLWFLLTAERGVPACKIGVPVTTPWALERNEMREAFPSFQTWVTTAEPADWYNSKQSAHVYNTGMSYICAHEGTTH